MRTSATRYKRNFGLSMFVYCFTVFGAAWLAGRMTLPPVALIPLALLPMVPALFALREVMIFARSWDELQKKSASEALVVAVVLVGMGTFAYGFLEGVDGIPPMPTIFVLPLLIGVQGIAQFFIGRRYK